MRDYKITRNEGEWYHAIVTDSYGNKYECNRTNNSSNFNTSNTKSNTNNTNF